jgi:hypothetical protein
MVPTPLTRGIITDIRSGLQLLELRFLNLHS